MTEINQGSNVTETVQSVERRAHARVRLELRCYEAGKQLGPVVARTLNISRNGALLLWNAAATGNRVPIAGEQLDVDLELPPGARTRKCIRFRGQVVRVLTPENQPPRVAVSIGQMSFAGRGRPVRNRRALTSARAKDPGTESNTGTTAIAAGQEAVFGWIS